MINVNASNRGSYGINGIFSYTIGKFNVFVGGNYNNSVWPGEGYNELISTTNDTTEYRITDLDRERKRDRYNLKAGFDFTPNDKNSFTFEGSFGAHGHNKNFASKIHEYNLPTTYDYYLFSDNPGTHESKFYSLSANYEYKLDKNGSNIQALAYFEDENESNEDKSLEYLSNADWSLRDSLLNGNITREKESGPQYRFQVDLVKKFKNKSKFESGVQLRVRPQYSEYEYEEYQADKGWVLLPEYGSKLNFVRDIYAVYGIYAGEYKSFGYQFGLRGEYTNRNVFDDSRDYDFKIQRFDLFPTIHFSKKFKNDHQILLSYSRRIDRPGGWELEPFTRFISSNFQRRGNPELEPEYTDNFELSYQKAIKQSFVSIEGY